MIPITELPDTSTVIVGLLLLPVVGIVLILDALITLSAYVTGRRG